MASIRSGKRADGSISPFLAHDRLDLNPMKFHDRTVTMNGEERAFIVLNDLKTLWINTGTRCNIECSNCYIESSPTNDSLAYIGLQDVRDRLDEIARLALETREIGLTGGEPFMNPDILPIIQSCLDRQFDVLVLTNAMRPMRRFERELLALEGKDRLTLRVSLDHHSGEVHELERGANSWLPALSGLAWLAQNGFNVAVAGRRLANEDEQSARKGYQRLFETHGLQLDADDHTQLVLFPELDADADIAEISTGCWQTLGVNPADIMCASSRMVVKRKGEAATRVVACTLLPHQAAFDMGPTLFDAIMSDVHLNHPHCARFCVLGGASCTPV